MEGHGEERGGGLVAEGGEIEDLRNGQEGGREKEGRRKGEGEACGGPGSVFVLLLPVCRLLGPLCRSWTPTPTLAEARREEQGCHQR